MKLETTLDVEEVVNFLVQQLPATETILSALRVKPSEELRILLRDLVEDCTGKGAASRVARDVNGVMQGVVLATANCVLEKQLDRLYGYTFKDDNLRIVNDFAQTVFNRVDVPFHVEEAHGVAYDSWKGEFREPPIVPVDPNQSKIYLRIGHF